MIIIIFWRLFTCFFLFNVLQEFLTLICQMKDDAVKPLPVISKTAGSLRPQIEVVQKTLEMGIQADSVGKMLGFHPFINRKLSIHTPPRPTEFLSRERVC